MSSSTASLIANAARDMTAGREVTSNTLTGANPGSDSSGVSIDAESVTSSESTVDGDNPFGTDGKSGTDSEGSETEVSSGSSPNNRTGPSSPKESITISDDKGRRAVEVDFGNRDQMKKYVQMAYGARKWQAERDESRKESSGLRDQIGEMRSNWDALEGAYQKQGVEGVIDLLEGRPGAHKAWIQKQVERQDFLRKASPEEIESLQAREQVDQTRRELDRIRKENEEFRKSMTSEREKADLAATQSVVHPVFDRYRFNGKLGNTDHEHRLDTMLWNSALKSLEPYEERGLPITSELVDKAFRAEAAALRNIIGNQAERKASKVVEQKKREATENVQAKVLSGYRTGGAAKEAGDLLNQGSGGINQLLKNWGRYGSVFGGGNNKK